MDLDTKTSKINVTFILRHQAGRMQIGLLSLSLLVMPATAAARVQDGRMQTTDKTICEQKRYPTIDAAWLLTVRPLSPGLLAR